MASANFINECKKPAYCNRYGKLTMLKPHMKSATGTSPLKITDGVEYPLNELKINGKTTQENTPTPSEPSELLSVGYNNLLIEEYEQGRSADNSTTRIRSKNLIPIVQGKTYVLTWEGTNASSFDYVINTSSTRSSYPFPTYMDCGNAGDWVHNSPISFTATQNGWLAVVIRKPNNATISPTDFTNVNLMVVDNGLIHNYIPYGKYGIEVLNVGKNIFNENQLLNVNDWNKNENGFYYGNITNLYNYLRYNGFYFPMRFKENTQYTISCKAYTQNGTGNPRFLVYYTDGTTQSTTYWNTTTETSFFDVTAENKTISKIIASYGNNPGTIYIKDIQVAEGTMATTFENYRGNTKVYELNEPLRSVGTYKDLLYIKNNTLYVERKIGKQIISNGTYWNGTTWKGYYLVLTGKIYLNNAGLLCNRARFVTSGNAEDGTVYENQGNVMFVGSTTDTLQTIKQKYDGSEILYILKEPVVEELGTVELPLLGNGINEIFIEPNSNESFEIQYGNGVVELNQSNAIQDFAIDDGCYDDGNIIGTVYCKKIKVNLIDALNYTLESESFLASVGLKYENNSTEYINLGKFTVEKPNDEMTTNYTSFVAYDDLLNNLDKKYGCNINFEENTITLADLYQDVCDNLGLIPVTTSFINDDIPISANPFTNNETNRFVLQTIAKIAASFVNIDIETNKIDLCWLSDSVSPDYTFYKNDYSTVDGGKVVYGPVNSLVIKNSAIDSENVSISDDVSILNNGEHQLVISDDYILNNATLRQQAIEDIWERVHGLMYVDCELTTLYGKPFLKIGDKIRIYTDAEDYIDTYVLQHEFTYNGAYKSVIKAPAITAQEVTTKQDLSLGDKLRQTEVIVDKQNGTITQLVSKTNTIDTKVNNNYQEIVSKFNDYTPQSSFVNLENNVTQLQTDTYTKTEINTKLTDGSVTKVHTVSGTFDENGMTYEKTNAATKTTINEIGVNTKNANTDESILFAGYVDNNNTQFADYKGQTIVATENIIIKKYFVMPEAHSRIEKYGNGGGMFYV